VQSAAVTQQFSIGGLMHPWLGSQMFWVHSSPSSHSSFEVHGRQAGMHVLEGHSQK
jgi:hypothetical protein